MRTPETPIGVCGVGSRDPRYSSRMKRKVSFLLFAITCLYSMTTLAQDKAASDRLRLAHAQYYTPTASGLKSFRCEATIDWKALLARFSGAEIPEDNPMLKYLQTVHLSVVDQLKGKGSMEWSDTSAPPDGKEEDMKQMRVGLQTMIDGFFQSWNAYMNGSMVPLPDKTVDVTTEGVRTHLHGESADMKFDEDYDENMLLTQVVVDTPEVKVVAVPTYVKTDDGLVVATVRSQLNQPPSAPPVEVTFRVEYAKVDSFQIPSHVIYDVKNIGVVEVGFSACQVSVADSAQKPTTDEPTTVHASSSPAGAAFAPLDRWKAAVLTGDRAAIKAFYVSDPRAFAQTPQGKIADAAAEESDFWSRLAPSGLTEIVAKILEQNSPQSGVTSLVLRIELKFQSKGESHRSVVEAGQVWAGQDDDWHIVVTQRSDAEPLPAMRLPEPKIPNTHLYPEAEEAHKDLDAALAAAQMDHKRVLVIFGANWCYDCHVLDAAMHSEPLASIVGDNYHVVHINIEEGKSNSDLADRFQVPLDKGVPSLAVIDGSGQLITSQKKGEFESAAKIGIEDISAFLNHWKPPSTLSPVPKS
jgi:ketosteroid isomerase-like protein